MITATITKVDTETSETVKLVTAEFTDGKQTDQCSYPFDPADSDDFITKHLQGELIIFEKRFAVQTTENVDSSGLVGQIIELK